MRADEARQLSDSKKEKLEAVLTRIEQVADTGYDSICGQNLHPDAILELMRLGYKVGMHKDLMSGLEGHIVSW